jgi:hypothetical protein
MGREQTAKSAKNAKFQEFSWRKVPMYGKMPCLLEDAAQRQKGQPDSAVLAPLEL